MNRKRTGQSRAEGVLGPCGVGGRHPRPFSCGGRPVFVRDSRRRHAHRHALQQDLRPPGTLPYGIHQRPRQRAFISVQDEQVESAAIETLVNARAVIAPPAHSCTPQPR